jgi:hypothetical protein
VSLRTAWRLLIVVLFTGIAAFGQSAATQPAGGPELLKDKADARLRRRILPPVNEPDEIVSVLRNGATVICKRVASPVAAVRGYACTGGVYEGKWLGGGLSHLLEHLVAGGSSERRTEAENKSSCRRSATIPTPTPLTITPLIS